MFYWYFEKVFVDDQSCFLLPYMRQFSRFWGGCSVWKLQIVGTLFLNSLCFIISYFALHKIVEIKTCKAAEFLGFNFWWESMCSWKNYRILLSSWGSACAPVATPVMITPSERKNSAARAISWMLTSDVKAWALWEKHKVYMQVQVRVRAKSL